MHKFKYLTEKDLEEGRELYDIIAQISDEGKEALKNVAIGINLSERAHKARQSA